MEANTSTPVSPHTPCTFPVLSSEELLALTIPFKDIGALLPSVLEEHGMAIIPDVLSPAECEVFEGLFSQDLFSALDEPCRALREARDAGPNSATLV